MGPLRRTAVQSNFRVQVSKDYLVFASAHFITFRGHQCETLHGHNYRVGVAVEGSVDSECLFVLDFSVLKQITRRLVDAIDHKVLLPTLNPKLAYREEGEPGHRRVLRRADLRLPPAGLRADPHPEQHGGDAGTVSRGAGAPGARGRGLPAPDAAGAGGGGELRPVGHLPGGARRRTDRPSPWSQ